MDSRFASESAERYLNRRFVRNGSPSPANMRAGSSPSRLNANTPAVNGNLPGRLSLRRKRSRSAWSVYFGNETRRTLLPDNVSRVSSNVFSLSRTWTTISSPE